MLCFRERLPDPPSTPRRVQNGVKFTPLFLAPRFQQPPFPPSHSPHLIGVPESNAAAHVPGVARKDWEGPEHWSAAVQHDHPELFETDQAAACEGLISTSRLVSDRRCFSPLIFFLLKRLSFGYSFSISLFFCRFHFRIFLTHSLNGLLQMDHNVLQTSIRAWA